MFYVWYSTYSIMVCCSIFKKISYLNRVLGNVAPLVTNKQVKYGPDEDVSAMSPMNKKSTILPCGNGKRDN